MAHSKKNVDFCYDDGTTKVIDIEKALADGSLTVDETLALDSRKRAEFTYQGKSTKLDYYTVESIAITTNPTKLNYEADDPLDFTINR